MADQATDTASAALLKEMADEMSHEIYLAGNHPMLGVDRVLVRRWRDRILGLLASLPAPAAPCGAKHDSTQAVCELPVGHAQNHRGPFAHGTAQWPAPAAPEEEKRNKWRLDKDGALDDVVVDDVKTFRLERMGHDHVWGAVYRRDGSRTTFDIVGDRGARVAVTYEDEQ